MNSLDDLIGPTTCRSGPEVAESSYSIEDQYWNMRKDVVLSVSPWDKW